MSIGIGEILLVLLICFFVVGPDDLPKVVRTLAKGYKKLRTAMKDITKTVEEDLGAEEIKDTSQEIKKVNSEFARAQEEVLRHALSSEDKAPK